MGSGLEFYSGGEWNYKDDMMSAGDNDPLDEVDSYDKVNLRFGLRGEAWDVMLYGRNIFDESAYLQRADAPVLTGAHTGIEAEGAVFGLRGTFTF